MIRNDSDRTVICGDCGKPAVCRLREARYPNQGARYLDFDSHYEETDARYVEMMNRVDNFHQSLYELQVVVKAGCLALDLPVTFVDAEIESIKPTACAVRTMIVPTGLIQAFGKQSELRLPARELATATADAVIDELRVAAIAEQPNLKARFERGQA